MSKNFSASRMQLALATWAQETTNPNTALIPGVAGSFFQRNGNGSSTPTEMYLNTIGSTTGWVKQNTIHLDVFNVKNAPYNAVGDGVADDTLAIWAAIVACNAAGGGIVYFPPGRYSCRTRQTTLAIFEMENMHQITFLGDGAASRLLMGGNGANQDRYFFYMHDGTSEIRFQNLYLDGAAVTNADEQTHLIFFASENADTNGGSHDCAVVGCYFGTVNGDNVRFLGSATGGPVYNHTVKNNSINSPSCRCGVAYQRYTYRTIVENNFMSGSDDQELDFEPTGGVAPLNVPLDNLIRTNIFDHLGKSVDCLTFNGIGAATPNTRCLVLYNQLHNGATCEVRDGKEVVLHGNVFLYTAPLGGDCGLELVDSNEQIEVTSNIFDRPNVTTQLYRAVQVVGGSGTRGRLLVSDNIARTAGDSGGGVGFSVEDATDTMLQGNICEMVVGTVNVAAVFFVRAAAAAIDGIALIGNMAICTNLAALSLYQVGASNTFQAGNFVIHCNYGRNTNAGVRLPGSGAVPYVNWRGINDNNFLATTGKNISILGFTNGVTMEGNAGPSAAAVMVDVAAGPEGSVPSPKGAFCMNPAGGNSTVMFVKETDGGSPTNTTGWFGVGPGDVEFAAQGLVGATPTALYLAPGMALVSASATEIQFAAVRPSTIRAIRLQCVAGVGAGNITFTVRKNGIDTALTLVVSNTATTGAATGSIAVAAGDLISVKVTKSGAVATAQSLAAITLEMS